MSLTQTAGGMPVMERRRARPAVKPASAQQRVLAGISLLLAALLLVIAAKMLLAGLSSYRVELALQRWSHNAEAPADSHWQSVLRSAQRANDSYPVAKGTYLDQLGQVHAWHDQALPVGDSTARASRLEALSALRLAVSARPTWPDTWVRLAYSKYTLGEFDNEFAQALEQANHWGPHRPDVQFELANIALRTWPSLTHAQRLTAFGSFRRVMDGSNKAATTLFALAQSRGLETLLCTSTAYGNDRTRTLCSRGGKR